MDSVCFHIHWSSFLFSNLFNLKHRFFFFQKIELNKNHVKVILVFNFIIWSTYFQHVLKPHLVLAQSQTYWGLSVAGILRIVCFQYFKLSNFRPPPGFTNAQYNVAFWKLKFRGFYRPKLIFHHIDFMNSHCLNMKFKIKGQQ